MLSETCLLAQQVEHNATSDHKAAGSNSVDGLQVFKCI